MNRATLIRGIQLIVALTLATFAFLLWRAVTLKQADLSSALSTLNPLWLLVAAAFALQEGVCGGTRMFVLGRVLCPKLTWRTAVSSEFVLMFVAGVTPGQLGAPIAQVATLVEGGMPFEAIATAELLTAFCTLLFFLLSGAALMVLRTQGLLVVPGAAGLDWLVGFSSVVFGAALLSLILCVVHPPLLKWILRVAGNALAMPWHPLRRGLGLVPWFKVLRESPALQPGILGERLLRAVDRVHEGFAVYLQRGRWAVLQAFGLTVAFFWARFSVAFFILKGLGLSTTPHTYVAPGPAFAQIITVQTLLNFALYLSPTPGASGIAEAGSNTLMSPWVPTAYELPYLVLWRILALFLCMFVGGAYVFRYLGTDVLERRAREAEAAQRALEGG
nr:flippase-like domain-containing protein [Deltaproteobacteria bacterium]